MIVRRVNKRVDIKETINNLELLQSTIEWEYPLDYQICIDTAVTSLYNWEKLYKEVKNLNGVDVKTQLLITEIVRKYIGELNGTTRKFKKQTKIKST
jgi:hypothetical protein